ncbi:MAG: hypothetical protein COT90_01780 [Candidatus Diapherotrites archaeon CG10_big_fil_rev_8_21_14_0_10_31_34]|nr:MAG: hypothetical protein COT90_01780 [Candidatus Diapherotrites archaeon CG10_big_fil_rev_8_21_14_0_10_31_34]
MLPEWINELRKAEKKSKAVKIWIAIMLMVAIGILQGFFSFFSMFFDPFIEYIFYGKPIPVGIKFLFYIVMFFFGFFVLIMFVWYNTIKQMFTSKESKNNKKS